MAIYFNKACTLYTFQDGTFMKSLEIDLRSGQLDKASERLVLYTPADVKKLARSRKISYVRALQKFEPIGIDDHSGANIYVPRG